MSSRPGTTLKNVLYPIIYTFLDLPISAYVLKVLTALVNITP